MRLLREWMLRLAGALRPNRRDGELAEELRLHMDLAAEAGRPSRVKAGGALQAMDALRDQRGLPWIEDFTRDVRHGLRSLRRTPVFTAVAVLTLALGIGANTAIFSIFNGVLLTPLPYPRSAQLVSIESRFPSLPGVPVLSVPEYREIRELARSFADVGAFILGDANLTAGDRPLRVRSAAVDEHLLAVLAVEPAHGRRFAPGETDSRPNEVPTTAILSHELWQTAFGGEPMIGRIAQVDGRRLEIVGIMPPGADLFDYHPEIWLALNADPASQQRSSHDLFVVGRLQDGVTVDAARRELSTLLDNWAARAGVAAGRHVPSTREASAGDHALAIRPLQDAIVGDAARAIWLLQGAVGLVLLITCANLANLLLARTATRRHELAMRAAIGASRGRLLRQFLTEGVLLSGAGALLGLWLATAGVRALMYAYPTSFPRQNEVSIDLSVLLFTLALSMLTAMLFGAAPAMRKRTAGLMATLGQARDRGGSRDGRYIRRALVTGEIALAVMLVIAAGLLIRSVQNLTRFDAGFDRARLVTFSMTLPPATSDPDTRAAAYSRLLDAVRSVPGVQAASAMSGVPFGADNSARTTAIENYTAPTGDDWEIAEQHLVMGDYFKTMGIPIVEGRGFEPTDLASPGKVVVINETLAKKVWKERSPVGQRLRPDVENLEDDSWHTIVGVARDVKQEGIVRETHSEVFVFVEEQNFAQPTMNVILRTALDPAALSQTIEGAVRTIDPAVPVVGLRDMEEVFAESIGRPRLLAQLLGGFAAVALLLAAIGTYGVLSYMVAERRREMGIRMAVGADRSSILALVMKEGLALTAAGIAAGLFGALGAGSLIASLLFGVEPTDRTTLTAVALTIALVAAFACWLPAWRASRLDPNVVLRAD